VKSACLIVMCCLVACGSESGKDSAEVGAAVSGVPAMGDGSHTLDSATVTIAGNKKDGLRQPRDLAFNPDVPGELWVVNRGDYSANIYSDVGTPQQTSDNRLDPWAVHFMVDVSSIAMGGVTYSGSDSRTFGTCQESRNDYGGAFPGDDFMGPSLWSADLDIFATTNPEAVEYLSDLFGQYVDLGSHLDMLHESPLCMGIAWESDNVYWVFDGDDGRIVRYDFQEDHDVGFDDHSDGIIARYDTPNVKRKKDVPSHMELDHDTGLLYIADTGKNRILVLDTATGKRGGDLFTAEPGTDHHMVEKADWWSLIDGDTVDGMDTPSGLDLVDGHLLITDNESGRIFAFTVAGELVDWVDTGRTGVMGIEARSLDDIWFVDADENELVNLTP
jgi:hypothetical protein